MTKRPAPDNAAHGRTIGEILLAYGYIDEDRLTQATEVQKRTGQPLGQLLVEAGTITRLELATALAEQWSDTPLPSREEAARNRAARGIDDRDGAGDSASLVSAAALAAVDQQLAGWRSVSLLQTERLDELEARIAALGDGATPDDTETVAELRSLGAELVQRISDLVDDVADLRARAVASDQLQPVLQELGERVEEALARPHGDPEALGQLTTRVDELAARPLVDESLQAAVRELSERPPGDVEVAARVRALEEQSSTLDALSAQVDELAARPLVDEGLQAAVRELSERPAGDVEVAARVHALEEQLTALAERPQLEPDALAALTAEVQELAARPLVDEGLQAAVRELSERPAGDVEVAARVRALEDELAALTARPEPDTGALDELTARVAALAERPAGDPELLGSLITRIEELAERPIVDAGALEPLAATIDELSTRLDAVSGAPSEDALVRDAVRELSNRFDELAAGVDELAARPLGDPVAAARVEDIAAQAEESATAFEALEQRVVELAEAVAAAADIAAHGEAAVNELASLRELVENGDGQESAAPHVDLDPLVARLDTLERALGELAAAPPAAKAAPATRAKAERADDKEVEQLRVVVDSMRMRSAEQEKAVAALVGPKGLGTKLEKLITRVEALEATGPSIAPTGEGDEASSAEASALQHDLRAVAKRVEDAQESMQAERDKLFQRLERMASSIDWRLQRLEKPDESAEAA